MNELNYDLLKKIMPKFGEWLKTDQGKHWTRERKEKDDFFKENFTQENIKKLEEGILRDFIRMRAQPT